MLVFTIYFVTAFFIYPIAQTTGQDELTTIGWAALFAGRNWRDVLSFRKYYGFGYTVLFTPLFWITDSPIVIYRSMLICNGVVNGISSILAYNTIQMLHEEDNKEMSFWLAVGMSFIPLKFVNVVNETIIICVIWSVIYALGRAVKEPHKRKRNTLVILGILLYSVTIHTRLLLLIMLVVAFIIFIDLFKKIKIINYSIFMPILFIGYIVLSKMTDKITGLYGVSSNLAADAFSNTSAGLKDVLIYKFNRIFSINGIKSIFITIYGQVETGNIVMAGVLLGSLVVSGVFIVRFLIKKEENIFMLAITMIALGGIILTTVGQGVMNLADFSLYDDEILDELLFSRRSNVYLRYYNIYAGPLIASTFIIVAKNIKKLKYYIISYFLITSIVAKAFLISFGDRYSKQKIYEHSPTYNTFSLGGVLTGNSKITVDVMAVMIIISLVLFILMGLLAKKYISYSASILSIFFIALYLINVKYVYNPNSTNLYNQNIGFYNTLKCVSEQAKLPEIIYLPEENTEEYRLQLFLNRYNLKFAKPDAGQEAIMIYRKEENIINNNVDVYEIDNGGYIVVQGNELKNVFASVIEKDIAE